jgi:hypothetical protein
MMTMTTEMLQTVGENLFGAHWIGELATRLNVAPRTVRRWARGEFAMPKDAQEALGVIARARVQEAARALEGLLGAGQN